MSQHKIGQARSQTIRATGETVFTRWNINSTRCTQSLRFQDGAPIPSGLERYLDDEVKAAMDHRADDMAAERADSERMVFDYHGVHKATDADRRLSDAEWSNCIENPKRKPLTKTH